MIPIDFVFFDAGGGHRTAAQALKQMVEAQGRPWEIRLVQLQRVLEPIDILRKLTGRTTEEHYNWMLRRGLTLGSAQLLPVMHALIRAFHRPAVRWLERHWQHSRPSLVVSVVPNLNRALFESLARALPGVPLVTILTDFADYPPHFWIERQPQYFICGTPQAVKQAVALGHPRSRVFAVSGMILRPAFYEPRTIDRPGELRALGLDPALPTGLVLFGGYGSSRMLAIAKAMEASAARVQFLYICGRNEKLKAALEALPTRRPKHVHGFVEDMPRFMGLADFLIGKPGPGTISEAIAMNLPVIVDRNAWTLPQERYNAEWVREKQVGLVVPDWERIAEAVETLLNGDTLARYKGNAAAIGNHAVFEIADILAGLIDRSPGSTPNQPGSEPLPEPEMTLDASQAAEGAWRRTASRWPEEGPGV